MIEKVKKIFNSEHPDLKIKGIYKYSDDIYIVCYESSDDEPDPFYGVILSKNMSYRYNPGGDMDNFLKALNNKVA